LVGKVAAMLFCQPSKGAKHNGNGKIIGGAGQKSGGRITAERESVERVAAETKNAGEQGADTSPYRTGSDTGKSDRRRNNFDKRANKNVPHKNSANRFCPQNPNPD